MKKIFFSIMAASGLLLSTHCCLSEEATKQTDSPIQFQTVSLKNVANLDFKDEEAGDGKGGWTDQGPENDLRNFPLHFATYADVKFDVVDPVKNDGKAIIGLYCAVHAEKYPKSATLPMNGIQGKMLYLMHAIGWDPAATDTIGTINVAYADGKKQSINVVNNRDVSNFWVSKNFSNAVIAWSGPNTACPNVGMVVSGFAIEDKPVDSVTFTSTGKSIWLIAGVSIADKAVKREAKDGLIVMEANETWHPFKNVKAVAPGNILDFSDIQDAPAGKYGFLKVVDNHFEFEDRPGVPAKFFGGNLAFWANFLNKEQADKLASILATMGYNILRLHHIDRDLPVHDIAVSTELNPVRMDELDYLVYSMKEKGVYITIDLYTVRSTVKGEIEEFPDDAITNCNEYKALVFISESARNNWKAFSANLLNHVNPYTGLAWKDEPAIVTVSLVNEDTILATVNSSARVKGLYEKAFNDYVKENNIELTADNRDRQWKHFINKTYTEGYRDIAAFVKDLGVKVPLTDQNMWSNAATAVTRQDYDFVDNHFYDNHPRFIKNAWQLPSIVANRSPMFDFGGRITHMFPGRHYDKPFSITEWDYTAPSEYVNEGFMLCGTYAALQNWDMMVQFELTCVKQRIDSDDSPFEGFDILNDPLRTLSVKAASYIFRKGYVKPAENRFVMLVPTDFLLKSPKPVEWYPTICQRLGLMGQMGILVLNRGEAPVLPEGTKAVFGFEATCPFALPEDMPYFDSTADTDDILKAMQEQGILSDEQFEFGDNVFCANDGDIMMNQKQALLVVKTPMSEVIVTPAGKDMNGDFATVSGVKDCRATVTVLSRDDKPLADSRRLLIYHITDEKSTGSVFSSPDFSVVENTGRAPLLLRKGEATITLKTAQQGLKLYACTVNGERIQEIPYETLDGAIRFTAKTVGYDAPTVVYELTE